jgi:hypothetical protein
MAREVTINMQSHMPARKLAAFILALRRYGIEVPRNNSALVKASFDIVIEMSEVRVPENQEEALDILLSAGISRPKNTVVHDDRTVGAKFKEGFSGSYSPSLPISRKTEEELEAEFRDCTVEELREFKRLEQEDILEGFRLGKEDRARAEAEREAGSKERIKSQILSASEEEAVQREERVLAGIKKKNEERAALNARYKRAVEVFGQEVVLSAVKDGSFSVLAEKAMLEEEPEKE